MLQRQQPPLRVAGRVRPGGAQQPPRQPGAGHVAVLGVQQPGGAGAAGEHRRGHGARAHVAHEQAAVGVRVLGQVCGGHALRARDEPRRREAHRLGQHPPHRDTRGQRLHRRRPGVTRAAGPGVRCGQHHRRAPRVQVHRAAGPDDPAEELAEPVGGARVREPVPQHGFRRGSGCGVQQRRRAVPPSGWRVREHRRAVPARRRRRRLGAHGADVQPQREITRTHAHPASPRAAGCVARPARQHPRRGAGRPPAGAAGATG